jgi:hypothetical protein
LREIFLVAWISRRKTRPAPKLWQSVAAPITLLMNWSPNAKK